MGIGEIGIAQKRVQLIEDEDLLGKGILCYPIAIANNGFVKLGELVQISTCITG